MPITDRSGDEPLAGRRYALLLLSVAVAYVALSLMCTWIFIGDAPDYAQSAVAQFWGGDCVFLEFGHLLWRPTGYGLLAVATAGAPASASQDTWLLALSLLNRTAWIAGLVTVLAITGWLRTVMTARAAILGGVVFVLVNRSFLNFSHVGTSYVPALAFLSLALYAGAPERASRRARVLAALAVGVCLAGSMLYWATYVFAAPAVLLAPLILSKDWKRRVPQVLLSGVTCTVLMLGTYAWVGSVLDLHSLAAYREWVSASQHGITIGGPARAIVGLARFVADLGEYGSQAKRYLLRDPYAPVRLLDLVNLDLVKLVGVYVMAALSIFFAWRAPGGRRGLVLFGLGFAPVLVFGVLWQGGDLERYLPALPVLALVVALGFAGAQRHPMVRATLAVLLLAVAVTNVNAMLVPRVHGESEENLARLAGVPQESIRRDLFVVSHWHDPLMATIRDRPFAAQARMGLSLYPLVTFGTPRVDLWREDFARRTLMAWREERQTWVSSRLLAERPQSAWAWIEGDDPRIKWTDIQQLFRDLELASNTPDGPSDFLLLLDTPRNRSVIMQLARLDGRPDQTAPPPTSCRKVKLFPART